MNLRVPYNVTEFLGSCATAGFSRTDTLHGDVSSHPALPAAIHVYNFLQKWVVETRSVSQANSATTLTDEKHQKKKEKL
jgi:hypothetical protein